MPERAASAAVERAGVTTPAGSIGAAPWDGEPPSVRVLRPAWVSVPSLNHGARSMRSSTGQPAALRSLHPRSPLPVIGLALLLAAFTLAPPVRGQETLTLTFLGVAGVLAAWALGLWALRRGRPQAFGIELHPPHRAHYVQTGIQLTIYAYWGWYWRNVYAEAPLILAQVVFLYAFDALLSWSRGRQWRLGFGPLPIILSTNLFIWFRDDWFYYQFLLVATCALGKEFVRWNRGGRSTHIFNPSAFGLGVFAIVLIATGTTREMTWGVEVATTLGMPPHIYALIFGLGLVVQALFSVTLMTLAAGASLVLLNLVYTGTTGVYHFVDTNIPIAVFLGLHLLMTDPSTSPRTNTGRVIFGGLYGVGAFALYGVLRDFGAPEFYDKLLTVPILNLSVQLLDRLASAGPLGALDRWQERLSPRRLNVACMGLWSSLFFLLLATGWVEGPHPGASLEFWKEAAAEGKPRAGENVFKILENRAADGSPEALNELGELYLAGEVVESNPLMATRLFARASEGGSLDGTSNLLEQFFAVPGALAGPLIHRSLGRLEAACAAGNADGRSWYLLGVALETGRGRPRSLDRALEHYRRACDLGDPNGCAALARVRAGQAVGSRGPDRPGPASRTRESARAVPRASGPDRSRIPEDVTTPRSWNTHLASSPP